MCAKELKHLDAGEQLTRLEDNSIYRHYIAGGVADDMLIYDAINAQLIGKTPTEILAILDGTARGTILGASDVDDTPVNGAIAVPPSSNWAYDHAVDLDAHTMNLLETFRTGEYSTGFSAYPSGVNVALVANTLYGQIFPIVRTMTFDRIAIQVTAGVAGAARLGIYNIGANLYPGTLLLDAGIVDVTNALVVAATINQQLTKGLYFLSIVSDVAPSIRGAALTMTPLGVKSTDFSKYNVHWTVGFVYAALPDPFPAAAGLSSATPSGIGIRLRVASLD